jgi:SulP family sulfate permease
MPPASSSPRRLMAGDRRRHRRAAALDGAGIAVGAPPQHGLYTAIVAGFVVALLGGSKHQVTGPTAAFVVVLAPIVTKHGLSGLLTAGLMAGILLVVMGLAARQAHRVHPVPGHDGLHAGIATVIATLQIKDASG